MVVFSFDTNRLGDIECGFIGCRPLYPEALTSMGSHPLHSLVINKLLPISVSHCRVWEKISSWSPRSVELQKFVESGKRNRRRVWTKHRGAKSSKIQSSTFNRWNCPQSSLTSNQGMRFQASQAPWFTVSFLQSYKQRKIIMV